MKKKYIKATKTTPVLCRFQVTVTINGNRKLEVEDVQKYINRAIMHYNYGLDDDAETYIYDISSMLVFNTLKVT